MVWLCGCVGRPHVSPMGLVTNLSERIQNNCFSGNPERYSWDNNSEGPVFPTTWSSRCLGSARQTQHEPLDSPEWLVFQVVACFEMHEVVCCRTAAVCSA